MKVTFFQNSKSGGPGLIGEYVEERGWSVRQILSFEQARRHAADAMRGDTVVFLGSPRSAYEMGEPWIAHEFALMRELLAFGTPVLGVCFGAQLLARVVGGEVRRMAWPFRGWHENEERGDPVWRGPWLRWHQDRIFLPSAIRPLATSDGIVQAFQIGNAVGVQFHPEATSEILDDWIASATCGTPKLLLNEAARIMHDDCVGVRRRSFALFERIFDGMLEQVAARHHAKA